MHWDQNRMMLDDNTLKFRYPTYRCSRISSQVMYYCVNAQQYIIICQYTT